MRAFIYWRTSLSARKNFIDNCILENGKSFGNMKCPKCLWINFCDCFFFSFNYQFESIDSEKVWVTLGLWVKLSPPPPGAVTIFLWRLMEGNLNPHPTSHMPTKYIPTHTHTSAPSIIYFRQSSSRSFSAQKICLSLSLSLWMYPFPTLWGNVIVLSLTESEVKQSCKSELGSCKS